MKKMNFPGIVFALALCALFMVSEVAWAGKPRKYHSEYGWATFTDSGTMIKSDGKGTYIDCTLGGEDFVKVDLYDDDGSIRSIDIICGRMEYYHPTYPVSSRRLMLCFDVQGNKIPENYVGNEAVYDILKEWQYPQGTYQYRSANPGYLNDGSVHAEIYLDPSSSLIVFVVDPGSSGTDPKAITDKTVNEFYSRDAEGLDYRDTSEYGESGGLIFYRIPYDGGFNVVKDPGSRTWTIKPNPGTAWLYVMKRIKYYISPKVWRYKVVDVYLATYGTLPSFEVTVSLPSSNPSPGKHNTLSSAWGEIKAK